MLQHICMYDSEERATCIVANRLWPMYGPQRWANKNHHPWIDWLIDWYSTTKASIHTLSRENAEWVTNLRERERERAKQVLHERTSQLVGWRRRLQEDLTSPCGVRGAAHAVAWTSLAGRGLLGLGPFLHTTGRGGPAAAAAGGGGRSGVWRVRRVHGCWSWAFFSLGPI